MLVQKLRTLLMVALLIVASPVFLNAASVQLWWQSNTEPDLQGYNVYFGAQSRNYANPIPAGKVTGYEVSGLEEGKVYYFAVTAVDNSGNESGFSSEVSKKAAEKSSFLPPNPEQGPIALWLMDEGQGTSLSDASGNGHAGVLAHNGTSSNPTWKTDAAQGRVVALDGAGWNNAAAGNYIDLGKLDVNGDQLTIGVMFKAASLDPYDGRLISKQTGRQEQDHYWMLSRFSNNSLRFRLRTKGSVTNLISEPYLYKDNEWVLAAATYDGSQMKIYCNGELVGSMAKTGMIDTNSAIRAFIGAGQDGSNILTTMDGQVAYAFVYQEALSQNEIKSIHANGKAAFGGSSAPADTSPPLVTITSPTRADSYETEQNSLKLVGEAQDSNQVAKVTWKSSNGTSGTANGTNSWSINSITLSEGQNVITVTAVDAAGNQAQDTLTVIYSAKGTSNPYRLVWSANSDRSNSKDLENTNISGNVYVYLTPENSVSQVTFAVDGKISHTEKNAPYDLGNPLDTRKLADGTHIITTTVKLQDATSLSFDTACVVSNQQAPAPDVTAPSLTITSPTSADSFATQSASIDLAGSASDDKGLQQISWSTSNGDSGVASGAEKWSVQGLALAEGSNTITVTAADNAGNTASDTLVVTYTSASAKPYGLVWSANADRSNVRNLNNATLSGDAYIHLTPETSVSQVTFFIDGVKSRIEKAAPYDLAGGSLEMANPFDTESISDGTHVVTAAVVLKDGTALNLDTTFQVSNGQTPPPPSSVTPPQVSITSPTSSETFTTSSTSINLSGTASDDQGIEKVTWKTSTGQSGTATGTTAWSVPDIAISKDTTLTVTAFDSSGATSTDTLTVSYKPVVTTPDFILPNIKITSPTGYGMIMLETPTVDVAGTASDNVGVEKVVWKHSNGDSGTCDGTTNWIAKGIKLDPFTNRITFTVIDTSGKRRDQWLTIYKY